MAAAIFTPASVATGDGLPPSYAEQGLISLDDLRLATITGDWASARQLMNNSAKAAKSIRTYSADRAWSLVHSYLRTGHEKKGCFLLQCMPEAFFGAQNTASLNDALALAARSGMRQASEFLLNHSADPARLDGHGRSALMHFAHMADAPLLSLGFQTLRRIAHPAGDAAVQKALCAYGSSAVMLLVSSVAPEEHRRECLNLMVRNGLQINAVKGPNGFTPVHAAAALGDEQAIDLLHQVGAHLHTRTDTDLTPLMLAAYAGHAGVIRKLGSLGVNVDESRAEDGCTAVHIAAMKNHAPALKALHEVGSNMKALTSDTQETALDLARELKSRAAHDYLLQVAPQPLPSALLLVKERISNLLAPLKNSGKNSPAA